MKRCAPRGSTWTRCGVDVDLLIATGNPGKVREFKRLLADLTQLRLLSLSDLNLTELNVVEDGATFADNALIKARAYAAASGLPVLADDSGLEVDHLGGDPGIFSARYAGPSATDTQNNEKLLQALRGVAEPQRTARYRIALVYLELSPSEQTSFLAEASCEGHILASPSGDGGFGYDPLFRPLGYSCAMAELEPDEKARISHRGKVASDLAQWLRLHLTTPQAP